jgi:hypothetical protein
LLAHEALEENVVEFEHDVVVCVDGSLPGRLGCRRVPILAVRSIRRRGNVHVVASPKVRF